jgi:hypothetical protein
MIRSKCLARQKIIPSFGLGASFVIMVQALVIRFGVSYEQSPNPN